MTATSHRLGELTTDEAAAAVARGTVVLLPVGAFEQHGPGLPLATDQVQHGCHRPRPRNHDNLSTLTHPNCGLMCPLEAMDRRIGVVIRCHRNIVLTRLCDPARHCKWGCCGRYHSPRAVGCITPIAYQAIHIMSKARKMVETARTD